jgi:hypothetical protein
MTEPKVMVKLWEKDGMWHYLEPYEPTAEDRERYPVSYPAGDDGPFYRWAAESFYTRAEAERAVSACR